MFDQKILMDLLTKNKIRIKKYKPYKKSRTKKNKTQNKLKPKKPKTSYIIKNIK